MNRKIGKGLAFFSAVSAVLMLTLIFSFATYGGFERKVYSNEELKSIHVGTVDDGTDGATALPAKYDLRDYGLVTSVKNQGSYGTCWSFAASAASESSLIKEFGSVYNKNNLDLSELHLAYFSYHKGADPLGMTDNDYNFVPSYVGNWLDIGGNCFWSTFSYARWNGPVKEIIMPYSAAKAGLYVAPQKAYQNTLAHLEETRWIDMRDMDAVKKTLMEKGALDVSYYNDDYTYLNEAKGAYYYDDAVNNWEFSNHSVTLVGWNDNYSRYNFGGASGYRPLPESDGAWLCKNSWGADYCNNGYFWISYEDLVFQCCTAASYDYSLSNYDYNYQYDGGNVYSAYYAENTFAMANVFTPSNDEVLKAVSFYTTVPNVAYSVKIYTGVSGSSNPTNGKYVSAAYKEGTQKYAGYHTVKLPNDVPLNKGEKYSVVISLTKNKYFLDALVDCNYEDKYDSTTISSTKAGLSFLSWDKNNWKDLYDYGYNDTLRIKAFTDNDSIETTSINVTPDTATISMGTAKQLSVSVQPSNAAKRMTWKSSNPAVATVNSKGVVTGVSSGTCVITATSVHGNDSDTCTITVTSPKVYGVKASEVYNTSYTLSWNAVPGATGYQLFKYNGATGKYEYMATQNGTSRKFTGMTQGLRRAYIIRARLNANGTSVYGTFSDPFYVTTKVAMGSTLRVSSFTNNSITLSWKAPANVTGYRVYMAAGSATRSVLVKTVGTTSAVITGLSPNTKYTFKVTAYIKLSTGIYEGSCSNITATFTRPVTPTAFKADNVWRTTCVFSWTKAGNATGYFVYKFNPATSKWEKAGSTTSTNLTVRGLPSGTTQYFKVCSYVKYSSNVIIESAHSSTLTVKTLS